MGTILRDFFSRFFGSEEVELRFITPDSHTTPAPQAEAQPASLPADAPSLADEAADRRSTQPLVLRPAPQAE